MNTVIEPCCYPKQLTHNLEEAEGWTDVKDPNTGDVRREKRGPQVSHFFSFSDWSTDELIPWTLSSVSGCEAVLCLVQLDFRTVYTLADMLRRTYFDRASGEDKPVVKHLTIITQTPRLIPEKQRYELRAQLGRFIDEGRVTVCEDNIGFRCIAASNGKRHLVIQGSLNQGHMEPCCQMYTMTTSKSAYDMAMAMLGSKCRTKKMKL